MQFYHKHSMCKTASFSLSYILNIFYLRAVYVIMHIYGNHTTHDACAGYLSKSPCGSGGIRTHASEETGALNQRLRPLGHATGTFAMARRPTSRLTGLIFGALN